MGHPMRLEITLPVLRSIVFYEALCFAVKLAYQRTRTKGIQDMLQFASDTKVQFQDDTFKYRSPVVGSHFGRTFLILARIWPGVPRHWLFPSAPGGHPPRLYPIRGLGLLPGAPNKENADEAVGIFGNAGRVWALPCDRTHLKKALCHIRPVVGRVINP